MAILFKTQVLFNKTMVGDIRYFNSAASLARSIRGRYVENTPNKNNSVSEVQVEIFSDDPSELKNFDYEKFLSLFQKHTAVNSHKDLQKDEKDYTKRLTAAIEACYTKE